MSEPLSRTARRRLQRERVARQRRIFLVAALSAVAIAATALGVSASAVPAERETALAGVVTNQAPERLSPPLSAAAADLPDTQLVRFDGARVTALWARLLLFARGEGWKGSLNGPVSGLRTQREQGALWRCFQRGRCAPAFKPAGPSRHLVRNARALGAWGGAVDVSRPRELIQIATRAGVELRQPYPEEPWHVEAADEFYVECAAATRRSLCPIR